MLLLFSPPLPVSGPPLFSYRVVVPKADRTALGIGGSDERCVPVLYRDMRWSDESLDGSVYSVVGVFWVWLA